MNSIKARTFPEAFASLKAKMIVNGQAVTTETWQGREMNTDTIELLNVTMQLSLRGIEDLDAWREELQPNLPWADEHFLERVSRQPLNPPPSWVRWPWAGSAARSLDPSAKFNHTYPERYWPPNFGGIRGNAGNLDDVVKLLAKEPHTRQAYLPIFFPEDTGIGDGGRKPCTLGYQFIMRDQQLHCFYPMRSCDLLRHFTDDVYLTLRLMIWVLNELRPLNYVWQHVHPASLTMHMTSLHVFVNDLRTLKLEQEAALSRALS